MCVFVCAFVSLCVGPAHALSLFLHQVLASSICECVHLGCPSQTCFFENQNSQPIPVVFGGWFEGSQKDF